GSPVRLPGIAAGAAARGGPPPSGASRCRLAVTVLSKVEGAELAIHLTEGELEQGPHSAGAAVSLPRGRPQLLELRSAGAIAGELRVSGAPPVPFGVQVRLGRQERVNFVQNEWRQRTVVSQ
ncbi:unnamed protein product, partial [Prorocentrum cordatum]